MRIQTIFLDLMRAPETVTSADLDSMTAEDWDALVAAATEHRCGPYLANILQGRANVEVPPTFENIRRRSLYRSLRIGAECTHIHTILAKTGIPHLFLKGVPLAFRDYPSAWMRPMRDIDVIVPENRLDEAYENLVQAGGTIDQFAHKPVQIAQGGKHLPPIHSPNQVLPLEIHYRVIAPDIPLSPAALQTIEREMWVSPDTVSVGGVQLPVPSAEMLLVHLLVHGLYDHELNNGPLFVTDLIHLIRTNAIDQNRFHDVVGQTGLTEAVQLAASLLPSAEREILCSEADLKGVPSNDTLISLLLQSSSERTELKLMATLSEASASDKIRLLVQKIFPDSVTLRTRWNLEGGTVGDEPRNPVYLWVWFMWNRAFSFLRLKSDNSQQTKANLLALRSALAGQVDKK